MSDDDGDDRRRIIIGSNRITTPPPVSSAEYPCEVVDIAHPTTLAGKWRCIRALLRVLKS